MSLNNISTKISLILLHYSNHNVKLIRQNVYYTEHYIKLYDSFLNNKIVKNVDFESNSKLLNTTHI